MNIHNPVNDIYVSILHNQIDENFLFKDLGKDVNMFLFCNFKYSLIHDRQIKSELVQIIPVTIN